MSVTRIGSRDLIPRQRRFTTSGSWVVPNGVRWVKARIVGAGADGALKVANSFTTTGGVGITGVGGGSVMDAVIAVTPGTSMPVIVGPSGTTGTYYNTFVNVPGSDGASSSFGGIIAKGGKSAYGVSSGPGSGYGAAMPAPVPSGGGVGLGYDNTSAGDGIDGLGAGSGSFYSNYSADTASHYYSNPGKGGVRASGGSYGGGTLTYLGQDAADNSGAAGGSLFVATGGNPLTGLTVRAGNGGSGIVILDWEEYA